MSYREYKPFGFRALPEVIKNLLIINVLAFFGTYVLDSFGYSIIDNFALYHWDSEKFKPIQLLTHLFLHGGFMHLFFNMFALWMFGKVLEQIWGGKRFLVYYLVTGLGAALVHLLVTTYQISSLESSAQAYAAAPSVEAFTAFINDHVPAIYQGSFHQLLDSWMYNPENSFYEKNSISLISQLIEVNKDIPTVGASGAIFGLLLAFSMLFPNAQLMLLFPPIPVKGKYIAFLALGLGVLFDYQGNIAHFAHLGGMIFGFIMIKYWQRNSKKFY